MKPRRKWVTVKIVNQELIGCIVGPFESQRIAGLYGENSGKFNLGLEKWLTLELLPPSPEMMP